MPVRNCPKRPGQVFALKTKRQHALRAALLDQKRTPSENHESCPQLKKEISPAGLLHAYRLSCYEKADLVERECGPLISELEKVGSLNTDKVAGKNEVYGIRLLTGES